MKFAAIVAVATAATFLGLGAASPADRHAGYYYPIPQTAEVYEARVPQIPGTNRRRRIQFVTAVTNGQLQRPYPPEYAMFAKGDEAEKLIIVSLVEGRMKTLYMARARLAIMTAIARLLPAFQETGMEENLTFFDLAWMLGFRRITISDGDDFAHQIQLLEPGQRAEEEPPAE